MARQHQVRFFSIAASGGENIPVNLCYYEDKNELFVNPTGRLCGHIASALISDRALAERYCEALAPRMQKRYGPSLKLEVLDCMLMTSKLDKQTKAISEHSDKVRAWLEKYEGKRK